MNIIVNGAAGRMGGHVMRLAREAGHTVAAAVDRAGGEGILPSLNDYTGPADVVIDFSFHTAAGELAAYCVERKIPLVAATTGYTEEEMAILRKASEQIPVFQSFNMSLGVALLTKLVREAAAVFSSADVEIVEAHHNRKADAPSGTAVMLANAVKSVRAGMECVYGRSGQHKRQPNEIGVHALRMGNVVGQHEVIFGTDSQTITLKHEAHDRALFAEGAVTAAAFLISQGPGFYNMDDILA